MLIVVLVGVGGGVLGECTESRSDEEEQPTKKLLVFHMHGHFVSSRRSTQQEIFAKKGILNEMG